MTVPTPVAANAATTPAAAPNRTARRRTACAGGAAARNAEGEVSGGAFKTDFVNVGATLAVCGTER